MFVYRFSGIFSRPHLARRQQLPLDLLNFSDLLCVCCTPEISVCLRCSQEAKALISQRSLNPRDMFKHREQSFEAVGDGRSSTSLRPGEKRHTTCRSSHYCQDTKRRTVLLFWFLGKLQSPFLSQQSTERETMQQPWQPRAAAIAVTPMSPTSPVSPQLSSSPTLPVSPTPPAALPSPVQATGINYQWISIYNWSFVFTLLFHETYSRPYSHATFNTTNCHCSFFFFLNDVNAISDE